MWIHWQVVILLTTNKVMKLIRLNLPSYPKLKENQANKAQIHSIQAKHLVVREQG
jgi:hypothetical protein